jgi:hypothetical protein
MIAVLLASLTCVAPHSLALPGGVTIAERPMVLQLCRWRQSRTWQMHGADMMRYPSLWRLLWPRVRYEATVEHQIERSVRAYPGERVTFENVPPGAYRVIVCDSRWNCSQPGNWRSVP